MITKFVPCALLLLGIAACGDDAKPANTTPPSTPNAAAATADHGVATDLGSVSVAGHQLQVLRLGEVVAGKEGAFEVHAKGTSATELAQLNVYLWLESKDGTQLSAPAKGLREGDGLHFHATPSAGEQVPFRVVLRVRKDGADERGSLPLDGHGHEHLDGPHQGVLATFSGGGDSGHLELKLHEDKGDLELWLAQDQAFAQPFDLPLDATVTIEFVDFDSRKVTLRPRDQTNNEDESGTANVRNRNTNYFVFPGASGEDASWLQGEKFQSIVVLRFTRGGTDYVSAEFVLQPHTH